MLTAFDPDTPVGAAYGALVRRPRSTAATVAEATGADLADAERSLAELAAAGLAVHIEDSPLDRWEATIPEEVADRLVTAEWARLSEFHDRARRLGELYRFARREADRYPGIEVVTDPAVVIARSLAMQQSAQRQVRAFDRPPYVSTRLPAALQSHIAQQTEIQEERMAADVRYRVIYHGGIYRDEQRLSGAMAAVAAGEEARILDEPPMKLQIIDESAAVFPLDPAGLTDGATLVVHRSGLLEALVAIFETLWGLAAPFSVSGTHEGLGQRDRDILILMATGATDDAIAHRLGLSRRTVARHTAALLDRLGATTRFQAGVQAARRGWL